MRLWQGDVNALTKENCLKLIYAVLTEPFIAQEVKQGNKTVSLTEAIILDRLKRPISIKQAAVDIIKGLHNFPIVETAVTDKESIVRLGRYVKTYGHYLRLITMFYKAKNPEKQAAVEMFDRAITELSLDDAHLRKPLLDGKVICSALGIKPGKIMKHLFDEMTEFEILNPKATADDALDYLKVNGSKFLAIYNQ